MKRITAVIALFIAMAGSLSAQKTLQQFVLDIKDFTTLKVVDGLNVDYKCNPDSAGLVVFQTEPNRSSEILFEANKGKLSIMLASRENIPSDLPTITVYSRFLSEVENDGDSLVRVLTVSPAPKFKAQLVGNGRLAVRNIDTNELNAKIISGNGSIVIAGSADLAKLNVTGTGAITADELKAREVNCTMLGTGTIGCFPVEKLEIKGMGTGTIYYKGDPEIKNKGLKLKLIKL